MPEVSYVGSPALIAKGMAALKPAVEQSAETLASAAQDRAPVDTGTLKASIHVASVEATDRSVTATIATGGEASGYAVFQELGTSRMAAHPYMGPATIAHARLHQAVCEQAWKGAFGA